MSKDVYIKGRNTPPPSYLVPLTCRLIFHPPEIIYISFMVPLTGPWSRWVMLASLCKFHPPGIFSFPPFHVKQGEVHIGWCWLPPDFSFLLESHLPFVLTILFSTSSRQIISSLQSFINGSGSGDSKYFPFTGTWT